MFFSKTIEEKIDNWGNKGYIGKLIKVAMTDDNQIHRARAYTAMGKIRDLSSVEALLECFKLDEADVCKLAAAKSLEAIATRKEFDHLWHLHDVEENEEIKEALKAAATAAKDRGERW